MQNGRIGVSVDAKKIVSTIMEAGMGKGANFEIPETRSISLQEAKRLLPVAVAHELRHVLQYMNEHEMLEDLVKYKTNVRRIILGITAGVFTLPISPVLSALGVVLGNVVLVGYHLKNRGKLNVDFEIDAYEDSMDLPLSEFKHQPLNIDIEVDPNPPQALNNI